MPNGYGTLDILCGWTEDGTPLVVVRGSNKKGIDKAISDFKKVLPFGVDQISTSLGKGLAFTGQKNVNNLRDEAGEFFPCETVRIEQRPINIKPATR